MLLFGQGMTRSLSKARPLPAGLGKKYDITPYMAEKRKSSKSRDPFGREKESFPKEGEIWSCENYALYGRYMGKSFSSTAHLGKKSDIRKLVMSDQEVSG